MLQIQQYLLCRINKYRMSVAIVSILFLEIGDFVFSDKAKNAFLYVSNHFSGRTSAKIRFLFDNATL